MAMTLAGGGPAVNPTPDLWRDIPVWAKTICLLGAPTVAAGFLIYTMTNGVAVDLHAIRADVSTHVTSSEGALMRVNENSFQQQAKLDTLIRIATQQCVNAATDAIQRRDCILAGAR